MKSAVGTAIVFEKEVNKICHLHDDCNSSRDFLSFSILAALATETIV